jgi:hypothetical protein
MSYLRAVSGFDSSSLIATIKPQLNNTLVPTLSFSWEVGEEIFLKNLPLESSIHF